MFWADKLLENVKGPQVVNDSWTPSGIIHMGSLKGPVIHDVLTKILRNKKLKVKFMYGFDDFDVIDGLPEDLQESHSQYLGVPICNAPSPDGNGSFGDYFGNKMKKLLNELEIMPDESYKTSQLYKEGKFDKVIKIVLDNAEKVRKVYADIYKKEIDSKWFPFQPICQSCVKMGTTKVIGWDGKEVAYECQENLVEWAKGCGHKGKVSPFSGNGKMPWKVEWAAKWYTFNVTIEGAGKDHGSAGGSYDVAMQIIKDVFGKAQPLKLVYEFFLSGGKKMSSSKGIGLTGEDLLEVLPPQIARFLMIYRDPNQAVEFSPNGTDSILRIFDEYQRNYYQHDSKDEGDPFYRAFEFSQLQSFEKPTVISFKTLAQWVQMPNMKNIITENNAEPWVKYARIWVEKYAPESEKFVVQKSLPDNAKKLPEEQRKFLNRVAKELDKKWNPEDFQINLYEWAKELGLPSKDAFSALYLSLIGKNHGPKAGWLILSLDKEFVKSRFIEASK